MNTITAVYYQKSSSVPSHHLGTHTRQKKVFTAAMETMANYKVCCLLSLNSHRLMDPEFQTQKIVEAQKIDL